MKILKHLWLAALMAGAALTQTGPPPRAPITIPSRLFGWADLHAHPASHLAFGSDANGKDGIFLGLPGGRCETSDPSKDLPRCNYIHGGTDFDHVRHGTHQAIMTQVDEVGEYPHQTADFGDNNFGSPSFEHWPHARSVNHQQMHITQIRRAYDGGQRLMIASVTDNEFLSDMWTKIGFNELGNPVPKIDPDFGYNSAKVQLQAIKAMAYTNNDWMQIAYSAAEARAIVRADKMALILSLEMDRLTEAQILKLVENEGVRQIIPIHLVDNQFGGTAVYSDAFNAMNNFLWSSRNGGSLNNDAFFKVITDSKIEYRLGRPGYPKPQAFDLFSPSNGAVFIEPVSDSIYNALGYKNGDNGHRNEKGLTLPFYGIGGIIADNGKSLIKKLAARGLLIDVSHMSEKSTADTLGLVTAWNYPVMSSHTDFRNEDGTSHSERDLHRDHAKKIADLGGVVGLGTDWPRGFESILQSLDIKPEVPFTQRGTKLGGPYNPVYETQNYSLATVKGDPELVWLKLRIRTGLQGLSGGKVYAVVTINGLQKTYQINKFNETWRPGLLLTPTIELPANTKSSKVTNIKLKIDNGRLWQLEDFDVYAVPRGNDPVATWLKTFNEGLEVMGGKGMAIGTDINGLAPQLWLAADDVKYPITLAHNIGPAAHTPTLQRDKLGTRTFDFKQDGIAHYGMLADFMAAVSQQPDSSKAISQLFHSAEDVVAMWEKCEKMKNNVQ